MKAIDLGRIKGEIAKKKFKPCTQEDLKPYLDDFIKETKNMELLRGENNDNTNAVIFYEYFQTENEFCIVQELCDSGLDFLFKEKRKENKTFTVKEIYQIFTQLNRSFRIMQENNLSHKDIRLEEILVKKNETGEYIYKLTGLEFNRKVEGLIGLSGFMTQEQNKAPEILNSEISSKDISEEVYQKADLWSIGINIYLLYFGEFPYKGIKASQIINRINENELEKIDEIDDNDLRDLVRKLLRKEKDQRIGWKEYFGHKFFSREEKENK